jgi:hypothetical protein
MMEHVQEISSEARPYLAAARKHFDTPEKAVVKARVEGDEFVMLWDRGINGIAKDRVPVSELRARRVATPKAAKEPTPKTEK